MMQVAMVGATGVVGQELERVARERGFPARSWRLLASERSAGRAVSWCGQQRAVEPLRADSFAGVDLAFFSAGAAVSREFAPHALRAGARVIDNSSAFRMEPQVPLVVPEVNAGALRDEHRLIANPNCSTIILVLALAPLHCANPVRRVVVSTYQAASGAGAQALTELEEQTRAVLSGGRAEPRVFPVPCAFNVFSHNTPIGGDGYNTEESKIIAETRKILDSPEIAIAPTCMRVPVLRAHLESLSIEFSRPMDPEQARSILSAAPGVRVLDDRQAGRFPTSLDASGIDPVLVGRVRRDPSVPEGRGLQLICAGDQLRKGAALNAIQVAELVSGVATSDGTFQAVGRRRGP
jgi:aspartate-semialdehyde dehydrogenase